MRSSSPPEDDAADVREVAEALSTLATLGRGVQYITDAEATPKRKSQSSISVTKKNGRETQRRSAPARLRIKVTGHYESHIPNGAEKTFAEFLRAISENPVRAASVLSVKLSMLNDNPRNSGIIELFNGILPAYAFTEISEDFAYPTPIKATYPPLTGAALLWKGQQNRMANSLISENRSGVPTDLTLLHPDFLSRDLKNVWVYIYVDLLIKMCPRLEVIEVPGPWVPYLLARINRATRLRWMQEHGWDMEVKDSDEDRYTRFGKKRGWRSEHVRFWFDKMVNRIVHQQQGD